LRAFSGYHTTSVLEPRGPDLVIVDPRLIFYYQNRLAAHGLAADFIGHVIRGRSSPTQPRLEPGPEGVAASFTAS
jgi:glycerol-3-phosphate O-acyltransferase